MSDVSWDTIENFVGFGNPNAEVLFLGFEEGLARADDLSEELVQRSKYQPFEDLLAVQQGDAASRFFGVDPRSQRTWRPMCHLLLRREGITSPTKEQRSRYQAERLGRRDGNTLLMDLFPYPNTAVSEWRYSDRFKTRDDYYKKMLGRRMLVIEQALQNGRFSLIVCYTKMGWDDFRTALGVKDWKVAGSFEVGQRGAARVVLAPAFSSRAFNSERQLQTFADICLSRDKR